jgi:hypothetical protein
MTSIAAIEKFNQTQRKVAFSKFHHAYDQVAKNASFFFVFDTSAYKFRGFPMGEFLGGEVLRYRRDLSYGKRTGEPKKIKLTSLSSGLGNIEAPNLIFFTGLDDNIQLGIKYDYKIVLRFEFATMASSRKFKYRKPKLAQNAGEFASSFFKIEHYAPTIKYEKGVAIPEFLNLKTGSENGLKNISVDQIAGYITNFSNAITDAKTESLMRCYKFKKENKFREEKYDSTADQLGGLQAVVTPSDKLKQPVYDSNNFMKIHFINSKTAVQFEYLHNYEETTMDLASSAIAETWLPLTLDALSSINIGGYVALVRIMNPGNISDRYLFLSTGGSL